MFSFLVFVQFFIFCFVCCMLISCLALRSRLQETVKLLELCTAKEKLDYEDFWIDAPPVSAEAQDELADQLATGLVLDSQEDDSRRNRRDQSEEESSDGELNQGVKSSGWDGNSESSPDRKPVERHRLPWSPERELQAVREGVEAFKEDIRSWRLKLPPGFPQKLGSPVR
jgi:hypothetical protein